MSDTNEKAKGFGLRQSRPMKVMINLGACFDIPTGRYLVGKHGESILNGGLANLTGMTGIGNSFKSTILHYKLLTVLARMNNSYATTYDTELNIHEWRLAEMANNTFNTLDIPTQDVINDGTWTISDKATYTGNVWYSELRDHLKSKSTDKTNLVTTPFLDRDNTNLKIHIPSVTEIDSFTEFSTDAIEKMQDSADLGESGLNAVSLKQGQHKNQFLMEVPGLSGSSDNYFLLVAHIGEEYQLDPRKPPSKKLSDIPQGKKIKGVPEKFTYVMNNCWWATASSPLINAGSRTPEYPRNSDDDKKDDTDLKIVTLKQIRGKSGPTGIVIKLVVSQLTGILPSLTEFNYIKESSRFGLEGNLQHYNLVIYPEVKLSRTTVRGKIDNDRKLRRAINITSELCQMHEYWYHQEDVMIKPEDLFKAITQQGYSWEMILSSTRGYWVLEEDKRPLNLFLSTMDILKMAKGTYHPYWLEKDKQTIKKEYQKYLIK